MKNNLNFKDVEIYKGYSQKNQHCYIKSVFDQIGTTNKFYVDVGAYNGITNSNVYDLLKVGWYGLMIDNNIENYQINLIKESVTKNNIKNIFAANLVPNEFDFLSIDIDGMDYWILESILSKYSPRVIVIETNVRFDVEESKVLKYKKDYCWDGLNWYGASPFAVKKMVNKFNYTPVYIHYDDMFIIRNDCLSKHDIEKPWKEIYSGPNFDLYKGHVKSYNPKPILKPIEEEWEVI